MYGRRKSPFWGTLLAALSMLYGTALHVRRLWSLIFSFTRKKISCPVISIGNITLGGTGKTPAVIQIAEFLSKNARHPVIISRGYGRSNEQSIIAVSDGRSILVDARTGGDEPVLIASKLPGIPVVVGQDRYQAALLALRRFGPDVVVLDDGFQHIRLKRDLDIVLLDAGNPFGNGKLFPAGILRESLFALGRADAVLITKMDDMKAVEALKRTIQRATPARIFTSRQVPVDLMDHRGNETRPLSALRGSKVIAFSGIAQPAQFTMLLKSLGADIAASFTYPDHFNFQTNDLAAIFQKAADEKTGMIVTTEKDAIRLKDLRADGIWALRIEMQVVEYDEWTSFLLKGIGHAQGGISR